MQSSPLDACDFEGIQTHKGDPLVISAMIRSYSIPRILVDGGSSVNMMYWACYDQLQVPIEVQKNFPVVLIGFLG